MPPGERSDPAQLADRLREAARELGIDRLAFAEVGGPVQPARFDQYLARGAQAGMEYLARHRDLRLDPSLLFSGTRTLICAAVSYRPADDGEDAPPQDPAEQSACRPPDPGRIPARVSRYALGRDYHVVLKEKLHLLLRKLTEWVPGAKGRVTVDTAPVLERYWAQRAGLGWIGRNGCLIVPGLGSYVFLGEILTNVVLPTAPQAEARCGTCRRCLEHCPTGALTGPGEVDARRCISYWTVEHRGAFPAETPRLSPWIFGCDRCQEVCPWNRHAPPAGEPAFRPIWPRQPQACAGWLELSRAQFEMHLAATPMERAGWEGLRRNAERLLREAEMEGSPPTPDREP